MENEFADALADRLRSALALPDADIMERVAAYKQGGPKAGQVTFNVGYPQSGSPNNQLIGVIVDIDVWSKGPDTSAAEALANTIEVSLVNWRVNTTRQGSVRLIYFDRTYMTDEVEDLAHVTMRLTGRAFRRL